MEWRCKWCGKPHDTDDPPCDNCGHGSFERAVVPRPDLVETGTADSTTVWVCTNCGRDHPKHSPPCSRCNNATLERQEKRIDESNLTAMPGNDEYETVSAESTTVWVCGECGREHPKHAPPCSRCGHAVLEPEQKRIDEAELTAPGYRELVTPRYLAALGVTLLLVVVFVLGFAGVVDVPGFPNDSLDEPGNVPGSGTAAGEIALADVEEAYLDRLNERRATNEIDALERRGGIDEVATAYNQWTVKAELEGGDLPSQSELGDALDNECSGSVLFLSFPQPFDRSADGDQVAGTLFDAVDVEGSSLFSDETERTGFDVHVAEDTLFFTQFAC